MPFKRRRFSGRRRRRPGPETYTIVDCFGCQNVYHDAPCISPIVDSFELLSMRTPRLAGSDTTEVTNPTDKFITLDGIKFQMEYSFDPSESDGIFACDPQANNVEMNLRVWEAIVLVPLAEGTAAVPAYVPLLTNASFQSGDLADRVLWKRISYVPIFAFNPTSPLQQLEFTIRDMGHGPVVVKSKVKIDDRHTLLYVRNYVHDIVLGNITGPGCTKDNDNNPCVVPVQHDGWFKLFYHTRR